MKLQTAIALRGPFLGQASLCEPILRSLPDWFGIEEAIVEYVNDIDSLPTFLALDGNALIGFMTTKQHSSQSAELYVLAVRQEFHRMGVGRRLLKHVEQYLGGLGIKYLQVKTLSESRRCEHYDRTRQFYLSMGFAPLEEFPTLWGPRNPCLQMIKSLLPA